ncbi:unnamed protein product [Dicrocoelium dendriticum]|nr:unnamed protein product [Dicrocoelium dendriticum]
MATPKRPYIEKTSHSGTGKKPRAEGAPQPSKFEQELMLLDDIEAEDVALVDEGAVLSALDASSSSHWSRPVLPPLDPSKDSIVFQQFDVSHYKGDRLTGMPGASQSPVPIVRLFGVTKAGHSVCAHIHGFLPFFYVPAPKDFSHLHLGAFRESLNSAMMREGRQKEFEGLQHLVLNVTCEDKKNIYGFHGNRKVPFLKITVALPRLIAIAKRILDNGLAFADFPLQIYPSFEANIDFEVRFMVETNITGCCWVEAPAGTYRLRDSIGSSDLGVTSSKGRSVANGPTETPSTQSRCQIEFDLAWDALVAYAPEGEWSAIAPLRILSVDIECAGRKGIFPVPEQDPVIQIANMVSIYGETTPFIRNVFVLGSCAPIVGSQVICHDTETKLLELGFEVSCPDAIPQFLSFFPDPDASFTLFKYLV